LGKVKLEIELMNNDSMPTELSEFLVWLKHRTEKIWSIHHTATLEEVRRAHYSGPDWKTGTRWLGGFSDAEIDSFEKIWNVRFPPDYRLFLQLLGAPDRPMMMFGYGDRKEERVQGESPSFYNWRTDSDAIHEAMAWPLEGLLFDVEHNVLWLDSWGVRPDDREGRQQRLSDLILEAPPLIPIIGHRYLLGMPIQAGNPVLSVYQSDIIFYGSDFREFLIAELSDLLEIDHNEAYEVADEGITRTEIERIPFWGEIILSDYATD
jgi:hypothetical protein